jgi:hypothetical protein
MGSNPTQDMNVWCVYAFILCLGRGLATSRSPVQGAIPSVKMIKKLRNQPYAPKWEQEVEKERKHRPINFSAFFAGQINEIEIVRSRST